MGIVTIKKKSLMRYLYFYVQRLVEKSN
jgi:hypothetical protein